MKVTIDHERCTGHGRCYALAPDVFEDDDAGYGSVRDAEPVDPDRMAAARAAALACPERAIVIDD